jgi:predicted anti-sigma-YlaC factor YlaD
VTCREFADVLCGWFDGELPSSEGAAFEVHLRSCSSCRNYLGGFRTTHEMCLALREAGDAPLPRELLEALVLAVIAARRAAVDAPPA